MTVVHSGSKDPETGTLLSLNRATDPNVVGRKAATLATLAGRGFRIPDGWVLPAMAALPDDDTLRGEISSLPDVPMAVRSSSIAEDTEEAAFAGQYETVLGVSGVEDILGAIRHVHASAYADRVRQYRADLGMTVDESPPVAILIQPLLNPNAAGVAFSANPVTGARDDVVINAVAGLGNRLMSGDADAEQWIVQQGDARSESRQPIVLDARQAQAIAGLARHAERELGAPQDIEWAIVDDTLYLLQSRPITALPVEPAFPPAPPGTWNKEIEHFTGQMSVALGSIYIPEFERATKAAFGQIGALVDRLRLIDRGGELYLQPVPLGERHGSPPPGLILGILARIDPQMRARIRACQSAFAADFPVRAIERWENEWRDDLKSRGQRLASVDVERLSDDELARHAREIRQLCGDGIRVHFQLAMPTVLGAWDLVELCEELFGWSDSETLQLIAETASASSAPVRAIEQLADIVRQDQVLDARLRQPGVTIEEIEKQHPEFYGAIVDYLAHYGHRVLDNEISTPTLFERPDLVLNLVRETVSSGADSPNNSNQHAQRQKAEELLRLRSAQDRQRFEEKLAFAARTNATREEKVLYTMYQSGAAMRYALREIGQRLVQCGQLHRKDDVFFCTFEEVVETFDDPGALPLIETVAHRRAERAWVAAHPGPLVLGPKTSMPDPSWLPEPARYLQRATEWFFSSKQHDIERNASDHLQGVPASAGRYQGPVRIIRDQTDFHRLKPGDVLICSVTTSAWAILFGTAGALVTDIGGVLSHPAIAAREHGLPAVVGTGEATAHLRDGQIVIVDGSTGVVEIVDGR
jgi:rifampicin phosphotransferase